MSCPVGGVQARRTVFGVREVVLVAVPVLVAAVVSVLPASRVVLEQSLALRARSMPIYAWTRSAKQGWASHSLGSLMFGHRENVLHMIKTLKLWNRNPQHTPVPKVRVVTIRGGGGGGMLARLQEVIWLQGAGGSGRTAARCWS